MSEPPTTPHATTDGLGRWLLGGLAAGGVILGLLVAAYAVGYHRGQDKARVGAPATTTAAPAPATTTAPATTPATTTSAPASAGGPVAVTPALVAQGKSLYAADGCSGCHSLSGAAGAGPSFKGLAGSQVVLTDGRSVHADDAYLERSITDPDADIVKGYSAGMMSAAISSFDFSTKPAEVGALVAFIKSQK
jgi:mono/diheme cytochrome c family protein